jgi:hypothetical protein
MAVPHTPPPLRVSSLNLGYTLPARVYPVIIVCLPAALALFAWFPDKSWNLGILSAVGVTSALTMLGSQIGRDLGKAKEPGLWESWGGKPTTQLLRHRDRQIDQNTKERYHKRLSQLMKFDLPTPRQEEVHPGAADDAYNAAVIWLIGQEKAGPRRDLLFKENVNYGFRRNLWAMRPAGILIAAIGFLGSSIPCAIYWNDGPRITACIATVANTVLLVWWMLRINANWIRIPAFRYAQELLSLIDVLAVD